MNKKEVLGCIDKAVGKKGLLRLPSWWLHKILSAIVDMIEGVRTIARSTAVQSLANKSKIERIQTVLDNQKEYACTLYAKSSRDDLWIQRFDGRGRIYINAKESDEPQEVPYTGAVAISRGYESGALYLDFSRNGVWVRGVPNPFYNCTRLQTLILHPSFVGNVTCSKLFENCYALTTLKISIFIDQYRTQDYFIGRLISPFTLSTERMFYACGQLKSLDLRGAVTSAVTSMSSMFRGCSALTTLDLSNFDTSAVTSMYQMFYSCSALTTLDLSNFDTSKVTNMSSMFDGCSALTTLDLSNFDTSAVTSMSHMFNSCSALTTLDLSNFDTSAVTSMSYMFNGCTKLTTVTGTISGIATFLSLSSCPLTNESAMVFINGLAEVTTAQTITFSATTYATLTEEQVAVATAKGWTVASA